MDQAYSIFMFCFSAALLLYAAAVKGDPKLLPRSHAVNMKNPKAYARQFSKVMAIVALGPAFSAIVGLLAGPGAGLVVLVPACVVAIVLGLRYMKDQF